jgi:hypothetical protein
MTHPLCDPQLLWEQMIEAHASGDGRLVEEHAVELLDWIRRGGTPPKPLVRRRLRPHADRLIALATCIAVLEHPAMMTH